MYVLGTRDHPKARRLVPPVIIHDGFQQVHLNVTLIIKMKEMMQPLEKFEGM